MTQPDHELAAALEAYDVAVSRSHEAPALAVIGGLLAAGVDPVRVLTDVVGRAQRRVGERWQSGAWSVAQEHAATAIAMASAEAVRRHIESVPPTRGRIVLACPEHEWHAVAAQILAGALQAQGWGVTLLGASTPAARLGRFLHDLGPDAAGVSCSVLRSLPAARGFIEASTQAGIPVIAGGVAFGPDSFRAHALGATGWAPDPVRAVEVLDSLPSVVSAAPPLPAAPLAEQSALDLAHDSLVSSVLEAWAGATRGLDGLGGTERDVVDQALQAVEATLLTGDRRTVGDARSWAGDVLRSRGLAEGGLLDLGSALARHLHQYPLAVEHLTASWPGR